MARIRTLKPDFFSSEDVTSCTPLARLFFAALWCESDREGRFEYKPGTLKNRYFPADKVSVEKLMKELTDRGMVKLYQPDGHPILGWVPTFTKHQIINNREAESVLPPFSSDACPTRERGDKAEGRKEGKEGREGEGETLAADADAPRPSKPAKKTFGEYRHVRLTDDEHARLKADFNGKTDGLIRDLDEYIQKTGKSYKDHALTIRTWARKDGLVPAGGGGAPDDAWRFHDPLFPGSGGAP